MDLYAKMFFAQLNSSERNALIIKLNTKLEKEQEIAASLVIKEGMSF